MVNYKLYKNFLSHVECDILNNWILDNKDTSTFQDANMGGYRYTTRYTDPSNFTYPDLAYQIQKRIISVLELQDYILPPYKDGMVVSHALPKDTCYGHVDPDWYPNRVTLHCNVALTNFKGGEPFIGEEIINFCQNDLLSYPVSKINHGSNIILGEHPRNIWIFGFCI